MKKKATLIATCVALPALLVLALSLTVFKADPPKETSGEIPAKTTVEQPVKEPKVDPPAKGQESTAPTEEPKTEIPPTKPEPGTSVEKPNPGETPVVEDSDEYLDDETLSVIEDEKDRIPIASMALLTDETTGKGIISLGDYIDGVKETLDKYELIEGDTWRNNHNDDRWSVTWYGDMGYYFDADGYLQNYRSWCFEEEIFETTMGLRRRDPVSRIFELYGRDYVFDDNYPWAAAAYVFTCENTIISIGVENDSSESLTEGDESALVCEIDVSYESE